jgi:hypothetical protein
MTFNTGFSRGVVRIGLVLLMGSPGIALSQTLPNLPVIGDISCGTSNGTTIVATTAAQFSTALTTAVYGDTITLTAGANFVGPFTLPLKSGTGCITIRTSAPDSALPAAGARITPAYASVLPKILAPGANQNAVVAAYGSHHYKFIGIEFMTVNAAAVADSLILIGDGGMTSLTQVPHHYEFDRIYVHAWPTQALKRGLYLNSASTTVKNSYVSDFKSAGQDTQAILIINGSGPFRITNNYLEASGENVLVGGGDPHIPNMVPSDIEITHNYFSKPVKWRNPNVGAIVPNPDWDGSNWSVKNILELKLGIRVLIDSNILEYSWAQSQIGYAVLFTVRNQDGTAPWSAVRDVTFTNNIIRHATHGMTVLGTDYNNPSQLTKRILIKNNLWLDIGWPYTVPADQGSGRGILYFSDGGATIDLTVEHNTFFHTGIVLLPGDTGLIKGLGFTWRNNIHPHNAYGVLGSSSSIGTATLNKYFTAWVYARNVMIVNPSQQSYPPDNFDAADLAAVGFTNVTDLKGNGTDYSLLPTSPYHNAATDGTDIGVDWIKLQAAIHATGSTSSGGTPPASPVNLQVR